MKRPNTMTYTKQEKKVHHIIRDTFNEYKINVDPALINHLVKNLRDNNLIRPAKDIHKGVFTTRDYGDLTPSEIARCLNRKQRKVITGIDDAYVPNIPNAVALIEQGWLKPLELTDKGTQVLHAIQERDKRADA